MILDRECGPPAPAAQPAQPGDEMRRLIELLPRPLRFIGIGGLGLLCDIGVFTLLIGIFPHALAVRLASLTLATVVTWRLNHMFTFARSFRHPAEEALRYAAVTAVAQGTSYAVFASLVLTLLNKQPQAALVAGAAAGAAFSYAGHRLFAFAPRRTALPVTSAST